MKYDPAVAALDLGGRLQLQETITDTSVWGWAGLLAGVLGGLVAGRAVAVALRALSGRFDKLGRTSHAILVRSFANPIALALFTIGIGLGLAGVRLSEPVAAALGGVLRFLLTLSAGWLLYNLVDLVELGLRRLVRRTNGKLAEQFIPLIRKALRVFLVIVLLLFVAENIFGADITAWLAGLGVAGLAVSLAAQDSIKNFFGSLTIFMDQPFAVGDWVTYEGISGTVESIGFRSTRIRTMDGLLVSAPNGRIVDGMVTNWTQRPDRRRDINLGITYDTPPDKIREALALVRRIFAEPEVAAGLDPTTPMRVHFTGFEASSLNIRISYWYNTPTDFWAFMDHAQVVNFRLVEEFNRAGIEFAFPTQTLYVAGDPKRLLAVDAQITKKRPTA